MRKVDNLLSNDYAVSLFKCFLQLKNLLFPPPILLPIADDGVHIVLCPRGDLLDLTPEVVAAHGERIFHLGRHFGINLAAHVAVLLQRAERYGEHFLRYVVDFLAQFAKTHRRPAVAVQSV